MSTNAKIAETRILIKQALIPGKGQVDLLITGNRISAIGASLDAETALPNTSAIDANGLLLWPGLVNTHHHIAQSILKGIPGSLELGLNDWLGAVPYRYWPHFTPQTVYTAARIGFSEMLASGCTTCADHHYLYHKDTPQEMEDAVFQAAAEVGIRLVFCRGAATARGSHRGMNSVKLDIEELDLCLQRLDILLSRHHNAAPDAMTRVVVAPTSLVHSSPAEHLREFAAFARSNQLQLHTHLLEVGYDDQICRERYNMPAISFAEEQGWLGEDVWFAHLVQSDAYTIARLGATSTGVAHCPSSNARLGSGIAPIVAMADAGVRISIGVDGSAAAESGSMINELLLTLLLHRTVGDATATNPEQVLHWGSAAGAQLLGYHELGKIEVGMLADLVLFDLNQTRYLGVWEKPVAPLLCGEPAGVRHVMVNGQWKLRDGLICGIDNLQLQHDARKEMNLLSEKAA